MFWLCSLCQSALTHLVRKLRPYYAPDTVRWGEVRSDGICELSRRGPSPHDVARKTDSQVVSKQEHVWCWIVAQLWESCGGCREGVGGDRGRAVR